ncbi:MAG: nucleotidyltransferase family protein [Nanoarchaeales archaeon]|nr:nucleotidyltransferase family protein [Nanoarchaeales archaeon]
MINLTKEIILDKLSQNKEIINKFGVKDLILFGSFARDEQKKNSDIDFLVQFETKRGLFDDYIGLLHYLEDTFERKIDLGKKHLIREELKEEILGGILHAAKI